MKGNRGSAIIEVTFIMPILLMVMVLFITMLLGVFQQAHVHSELMYYSAESKNTDWNTSDAMLSVQGDKRIYSQNVNMEFVQGYPVSGNVTQIVRVSRPEENLRRWQVIGGMAAE
ncbi:MAG: hypothetical protein NC089_03300 [Bacteroides sp.]|nr:hypothetical protein [Bacteroides sp.]MCM1549960.1 hypothetical protein [Clostridium sp.]